MSGKSSRDVERVAEFLGCSTRRVRALLQQGRIRGFKVAGVWQVAWPFHVLPGRRGPDLRYLPVRKLYGPYKPAKGGV